jgi:hypothetical protein
MRNRRSSGVAVADPVWLEPHLWGVQHVTQMAYKLVGLRDFGRVDLRVPMTANPIFSK